MAATVTILPETVKNPITVIGHNIGICYGSDTSDDVKNYNRGLNSILAGHGRVLEFADVHLSLKDVSARTIRQWYTHIGGSPTRVQESTRYIDYSNFTAVIPPSIEKIPEAKKVYLDCLEHDREAYHELRQLGISKEDAAMLAPLGMNTGIVCKHNARNLMDMSSQRLCARAYWEYRDLMRSIINQLKDYSEEWNTLATIIFKCKCDKCGYCEEEYSCGKYPKLELKK